MALGIIVCGVFGLGGAAAHDLEGMRRPTPTALHVVVARDWAELIDKLRAIAACEVA